MNNEILKKLEKNLNEMKTLFEEESIFGIYAYGDVNYNDNIPLEEVKTEIIYIPTFEELCFDFPVVKKEKIGNEEIIIRDIRNVFTIDYNNSNLHCAELLYTDYYIINPKYELVFNNIFKEYRDEVVKNTREIRLVYAARLGISYLYKNEISKANILYDFCEKLRSDANPEEFFTINEINKSKEELKIYFENILFISAKIEYGEKCQEIKEAIMNIIKLVIFKDNDNLQKFIDELTVGESLALKAVIRSSESDGLVNISKLSEEIGVSRQLFSNLFSKLKINNYAIIKNMGMKGTYIRFLNNSLINKIIDKK